MIVETIALQTGLPKDYVELIARTASHRYKTYQIPKKTGGMRTIHHPAREVKLFQRWLAQNVFERLPVHEAAFAYRKGTDVGRHASRHLSNNYVLKVDFIDFFPSITGSDVIATLKRNSALLPPFVSSPEDFEVIRMLVTKDGHLTIGAPSSPILSNSVMFEFDEYWSVRCNENDIVYTRYSDDLYFSTNKANVLKDTLRELRRDLALRTSPKLHVNDKKTVFTSRKRMRLVTGLILTSDKRLSLGRKRKRWIKSLVFEYINGRLAQEKLAYLQGIIAYARSVEPRFVGSLSRKYGGEALKGLYVS